MKAMTFISFPLHKCCNKSYLKQAFGLIIVVFSVKIDKFGYLDNKKKKSIFTTMKCLILKKKKKK